MTGRAVIIAFLAVLTVCLLTYYNDQLIGNTFLIGNNMPVSIYGSLLIFLLTVNVGLFYLGKRFVLSAKELALILTIVLAVCCIPGSGLMRTFVTSLIMPHQYALTDNTLKSSNIVSQTPDIMLADVNDENQEEVLNKYLAGGAKSFGDIPWYAWKKTLIFWLPLIFCLWIALLGLSMFFHQQWSKHEHLPYPLAHFASQLITKDEDSAIGPILKHPHFWISTISVFLIYLNNYINRLTGEWIDFPTRLKLDLLAEYHIYSYAYPVIYFSVIGFAYFLDKSISLSVGIAPVLYHILVFIMAGYSIQMSGNYMGVSNEKFLQFGAYLAMAGIIIYIGRHFYREAIKASFGIKTRDRVPGFSIFGFRLFMLASIAFTVLLTTTGLDWQLAILYTIMAAVLFTVMSRIIAETGIFYIQAFWLPSAILIGFFGHRFVGTEAAVILLVLCSVLMIDPREALMPFMTNSLKLLEEKKINISKASSLCMAAIIIGLAVCVPWTIYLQYKNGPPSRDWWARVAVPPAPFREAAKVDYRLKALGPEVIKNSNGTKGFDRFTNFKAMPREYWIFLFVGITMVSLFAFARLRFTWFPLHPIIFLVWSTAPARRIGFAFLIGWLLKMLITKYGGVQVYNKLKPLMLGFIAGELLGAFLPIIVSLIYYFMTGQPAAPFRVFPG